MTRQNPTRFHPIILLTKAATKVKIVYLNKILSEIKIINNPIQQNPKLIKSLSSRPLR